MLLEYVIDPAMKKCGYSLDRADKSAEPGVVTIHVIRHLLEDDLVIADITDRNPNVFYELAIRHAIRKPFVQLVAKGENIPFNIQGIQTVEYDTQDPKCMRETAQTIENQVLYYERTGNVTSPVSIAIDTLLSSTSVEQFRAIMDRLSELDSGVDAVQQLREELLQEVRNMSMQIQSKIDSDIMAKIDDMNTHLRRRGKHSENGAKQPSSDYEEIASTPHEREIARAAAREIARSAEGAVWRWIEKERDKPR